MSIRLRRTKPAKCKSKYHTARAASSAYSILSIRYYYYLLILRSYNKHPPGAFDCYGRLDAYKKHFQYVISVGRHSTQETISTPLYRLLTVFIQNVQFLKSAPQQYVLRLVIMYVTIWIMIR